MTCELHSVQPPAQIYRVGRGPDPLAWPDWSRAHDDGTFGNRWDDPEGSYRVLYGCSQRLGCFIEILARFRPDPHVVAGLEAVRGPNDGPSLPPGYVPLDWVNKRMIGQVTVDGPFADIGHSESLGYLRVKLASRIVHFGLSDLDGSAIRTSVPRQFTQEISRLVFECSTRSKRTFSGVHYLSRLGDEFLNWAIFEGVPLRSMVRSHIDRSDPDLLTALQRLGIQLGPHPGARFEAAS
jgi:hypothetical protein